MNCHQKKSVISLVDSLVHSANAPSQSSGPLLVLRCEKVFMAVCSLLLLFSWPAKQTFPFGFGAKRDRGTTCNGIFGFGRAKNGTSGHFSRGLWPSFLVLCSETARKRLLRVLLFRAQKWPLLIASRSWERFTKRRNDGQRRKEAVFRCKEFIFLSLRNV